MKYILLTLLLICSNFFSNCYADDTKDKTTKEQIPKEVLEKAIYPGIIKKVKIAVVNVTEVLEKSLAIHSINKQFEELTNNIQKLMTQKESELQFIEKDLIKEKEKLSEEEFEEKVQVFNKQIANLQELGRQNKNKLELVHSDAINEVHKAMLEIFDKLSNKYNFYVALPTSQVLFAKDCLDITDEVIELLNQNIKTVKITLDGAGKE